MNIIAIIIALVITILYFIFGRLLQSAGKELGNTSLRKAGNIIIFIIVLTLFTSALFYLSITKPQKRKVNTPIIIEAIQEESKSLRNESIPIDFE